MRFKSSTSLTILMFFVFFLSTVQSIWASIGIGFDPSPDPSVVGYNLYYGFSESLEEVVDLGPETEYRFTDLQEGATYYFAATAYDENGFESDFSNVLAIQVPFDSDSDGDGTPDSDDLCPVDPAKTSPGACGCGVADIDSDGDGISDCDDLCPVDPAKTSPGACGCGVADIDSDGDGISDCDDLCPVDPAKTSPGACGCGVADIDSDGDGISDCDDLCPVDPAKTSPGACGCGVADIDSDGDGISDCDDLCPVDPAKTSPGACGCGVADIDSDGDGISDCDDLCPDDPAKTSPGACGCGVADIDSDGNGISDCDDTSPDDSEEPDLSGDLILDLEFRGNMLDESGFENHGFAYGDTAPSLVADRFGNPESAYEFDGVDDFISIEDNPVFDTPAYTVVAWIYARKDLHSSQYLVSKNTGDGAAGVGLFFCWDRIYTCGPGYPHSESVLAEQENVWIQVAVARDADGTAKFYLDGTFAGEYETSPNAQNTLDLIIGARTDMWSFFQGIIDDLQIYNTALTEEQIGTLYEATRPDGAGTSPDDSEEPDLSGDLILDLEFRGNMLDESGFENHGYAYGDTAPFLVADRFGNPESAYEFDGVDDFISIEDNPVFDTPAYTVVAWIYARKDLHSSQYLVSKNTGDGAAGVGLFFCWDRIYTCGPGYPHSEIVLAEQENVWIQVAVARDADGTAKFYLDGTFAGEYETSPNAQNTLDLIIGGRTDMWRFFQGIIDDLQIYNTALTEEGIGNLYEASKPDGAGILPDDPSVVIVYP